MTERPPPNDDRRRSVFWIVLILLALSGGIAGLWKLSHLIATEPKPVRR